MRCQMTICYLGHESKTSDELFQNERAVICPRFLEFTPCPDYSFFFFAYLVSVPPQYSDDKSPPLFTLSLSMQLRVSFLFSVSTCLDLYFT